MNEPDVILKMLGGPDRQPRTIAVVGLSDDPTRPSHSVSAYMQRHGYRIIPVNPGVSHVLGEQAYPSLHEVPGTPDIVFPGRLKLIFVNGCFWHGHESCAKGRLPKSRTSYWGPKIEKNRIKDHGISLP